MLSTARSTGLLATLILTACAAGGPSPTEESPGRRGRSSKVLTAEDLSDVFQLNALQAVELLRPAWLRNRGPVSMESSSSQGVRLYVDGNPRGAADELAGILTSDVLEMRFLDSREATTRYGTGYPDGVIVIRTKHRQ
jgi:hypothetical protein